MQISAQMIKKDGCSSSHGDLSVALYWATLEGVTINRDEQAVQPGTFTMQGILIIGDFTALDESTVDEDDEEDDIPSYGWHHVVFHPFVMECRYYSETRFGNAFTFPDPIEETLFAHMGEETIQVVIY